MQSTTIKGVAFVNLTPHAIDVVVHEGSAAISIPASGAVARVAQSSDLVGEIAGIPVFQNSYGDVEGIPAPQDGTVYIVSAMAAQAVRGRDDVLVPGPAVRDADGRIIGCNGLCRI